MKLTTKQEVQEFCAKQPEKENIHAVSKDKDKSKKFLVYNYCENKKDPIVSQTKDFALPGEQFVSYVGSKITFKIPRNVGDYKKKCKLNQRNKYSQNHQSSSVS